VYDFVEVLCILSIFIVEDSGDDAVFTWLLPKKMSLYPAAGVKSLLMCSQ